MEYSVYVVLLHEIGLDVWKGVVFTFWFLGLKLEFSLFRFCMVNKKSEVRGSVRTRPMENPPRTYSTGSFSSPASYV